MSEILEPSSTCPAVFAGVEFAGNPLRKITDVLAAQERADWLAELDAAMARR